MKKDYSVIIYGLAFIVVGIILSGNILGLWTINIFFDGWWTLFLIIPGLVSILRYGFDWGYGIMVTIGIVFLLDSQEIIDSSIMWKLIFPLVLVAIGTSIITSFFKKDKKHIEINYNSEDEDDDRRKNKGTYKTDDAQHPQYRFILGGGEVKNNSRNLQSVTVDAILGGIELDLRDAVISQDIELEITVVLGGVDIWLPNNVGVEIVSGTPVLGAITCKPKVVADGAPIVRVKYVTVLGGAEIK